VNRLGVAGEALAANYLEARGLKIVARNYHCRLGEIDLIAREGGATVFIEVRQRKSSSFGGAAASITERKRMRLIRAARHYLAGMKAVPPCRFDALLIEGDPPRIEWIRDAFGA
jgi:putative endonuclease